MAQIDIKFYEFLGKALRSDPAASGVIPDDKLVSLTSDVFQNQLKHLNLRFENLPKKIEDLKSFYADLTRQGGSPLNFLLNPLSIRNDPRYFLSERFYRGLDTPILNWIQKNLTPKPPATPTLTRVATTPILQSQAEAAAKISAAQDTISPAVEAPATHATALHPPGIPLAPKASQTNETASQTITTTPKVTEAEKIAEEAAKKPGVATEPQQKGRETMASESEQAVETLSTTSSEPQPTGIPPSATSPSTPTSSLSNKPSFQLPKFRPTKLPYALTNSLQNFGSAAGRAFQGKFGKFFTLGGAMTGASALIGGFAGAGLTGGNPLGIMAGAGTGAILPSWVKSGGGRFFSNAGRGAVNSFSRLPNQLTNSRLFRGPSKVAWLLLGGFVLLIFGTGFMSAINPLEQQVPGPPGGLVANIANCRFTRSGSPKIIPSSILQGWIVSAANSVGIAPAILASVAMHESQNFVANADNNHDAIRTNQYCNKGKVFCEKSGQVLHSKLNEDDPCTSDEIANGAKTAQAVGLMQLLDIYNPGKDLCSITESLNIAATKLKADGITLQPTQQQINTAIRLYYNSCNYGSFSYCDEVWNDIQNCRVSSGGGPIIAGTSCPIPNGVISCASYGVAESRPGFDTNCAPSSNSLTGEVDIGGHCAPKYRTINSNLCSEPGSAKAYVSGGNLRRTAKSIDVISPGGSRAGDPVYLPTTGGQSLRWFFVTDVPDNEGSTLRVFQSELTSQGKWTIHFIHTDPIPSFSANQPVDTTQPVAQISAASGPGFHVHVTVGLNITEPITTDNLRVYDPGWRFPDRELGMCR